MNVVRSRFLKLVSPIAAALRYAVACGNAQPRPERGLKRLLAIALAIALLGAGAGCRPNAPTTAPPLADPRRDASAASIAQPHANAATDAGAAPLVDLLHSVECVVAVSSKVANPQDFPEHLVDGKNETAWNSRTGDLHGAISFRVPAATRVKRVELTVGFAKSGPKGDLFTMNHRITKVRLSRQGKIVKEVDLAPEVRALQGFDVDEEGGDFELAVLATLPGSEKTWKELTVSEFRVLGLANGAPENPQHLPAMAIGSLDGVKPYEVAKGAPPPGPFASVKELCVAYDAAMAAPILKAFPGDRYPGEIGRPHCVPLDRPKAGDVRAQTTKGPFRSGQFVRVNDTKFEKARLVLETERGVSLTDVVLWSRYHDDPGCGHASDDFFEDATLMTTGLGRETLILRLVRTDVYWLGATDPGATVESAYACSVDATGAASCEGPVVVGRSPGWPTGWDVAAGRFPRVDAAKETWTFRRAPVLGPAGDLR